MFTKESLSFWHLGRVQSCFLDDSSLQEWAKNHDSFGVTVARCQTNQDTQCFRYLSVKSSSRHRANRFSNQIGSFGIQSWSILKILFSLRFRRFEVGPAVASQGCLAKAVRLSLLQWTGLFSQFFHASPLSCSFYDVLHRCASHFNCHPPNKHLDPAK